MPTPAPAFTVLIPARMSSSRLPGKPLADIGGKPMVVRVAERARLSHASQVVVAADAPDILHACAAHGVQAVPTRADHPSGSDRLAQACALLGLNGDDVVVNVQGDEPLMDPALINAVAALLAQRPEAQMGTAAHPIDNVADFINPNVVKVITDAQGLALTFSRAPLPWHRDAFAHAWTQGIHTLPSPAPLRHIGIYSYRAGFLRQFPQLPPAPIEQLEALEQLRALWHGHRIAVHTSAHAPGPGVDTPEDLARIRAIWAGTAGGGGPAAA